MEETQLPRRLLRRLEKPGFPLLTLDAIRQTRIWLDNLETQATTEALALGASALDIADATGLSRQGVYRRLKTIQEAPSDGTGR